MFDRSSFSPARDVRVALAFLTRIPVGWVDGTDTDMHTGGLARVAWAFPVVGLIVGGGGGAALYGAAFLDLHPLACALMGLAVMAAITGGLHEDGLADVADGFGGGGEKTRILEIMRDSRIGSFGVIALVFTVGIRAAALSGVPGPGAAWITLIAGAVFSRAVLPVIMAIMPPARTDGFSHAAGCPSMAGAITSLGIGLVAMIALLPSQVAWVAVVIVMVFAGPVIVWAQRRLGGQTGDVLGAVQQVSELAVIIAAAGWSTAFHG